MCCQYPEKDSYWFWGQTVKIKYRYWIAWPEEDTYGFWSPKVKTKFWELEFVAVQASFDFLSPAFRESVGIKTHLSVCPSVHLINLNLAHIFWSINDRAMIFGMRDPYDKPFQFTPCRDLDLLQGQSCFRLGTTILRILVSV